MDIERRCLLRNRRLPLRLSQEDLSQGMDGLSLIVVRQFGGRSERVLKILCGIDDVVGLGELRDRDPVMLEAHRVAHPLLVCPLHCHSDAAVLIEAGTVVVALAGVEAPGCVAARICACRGNGHGVEVLGSLQVFASREARVPPL